MKAVAQVLWIVVTAVVVFIVAVVILAIFSGGMDKIIPTIHDWIANVTQMIPKIPKYGS